MSKDGFLYTGANSKTVNNAEKRRKEAEARLKEKKNKRNKLLPAYEIVTTELDKEREASKLLLINTIETDTTETDIKAIVLATKLYIKSMSGLQARLNKILRSENEVKE